MPEFDLAKELGRKVPFSAEAEQSVLGSVLIDPDCFNRLTGVISESDFYMEEHRLIYAAMQSLFAESRDIDPVTLINAVETRGSFISRAICETSFVTASLIRPRL